MKRFSSNLEGLISILMLSLLLPVFASAETYAYDPAGRLTDVVYPDNTFIHYSYDNMGNILSRRVGARTTADLAVVKTGIPNPVLQGQSLSYTVKVTNNGPSPVAHVKAIDALPASASFASVSTTQGACIHSAGIVTCTLGAMTRGATATFIIVVTPTVAGLITNSVTVSGSIDPTPTNNTATQNTTVLADTDADGISDDWEITWFGNLTTATAISDFDGDGISDLDEYLNGNNPKVKDECIRSGFIGRVTIKPGNGNSAIYLRTSSRANSYKYFSTTDAKLIKAAVKSLPGKTWVKIKGNRICTVTTNGGAVQYVIVAP